MNLAGLIFLMMLALIVGKRSKKFGAREYTIAFILALLQMGARLAVVKWLHEGKVNPMLAESFENVIYKDYQPVVASHKM